MSTRGIFTFVGDQDEGTYHLYLHGDGNPGGVAEVMKRTLPLAWPLPRFEAGHFAASFIAASVAWYVEESDKLTEWFGKDRQGYFGHGVRLILSPETVGDAAFTYETRKEGGEVVITVRDDNCRLLYKGKLKNFIAWAIRWEKKACSASS